MVLGLLIKIAVPDLVPAGEEDDAADQGEETGPKE
jgi:hypothetical protein